MLLGLIIAAAIAGPPTLSEQAATVADAASVAARERLAESVESALLADPDLAHMHAGYTAFLDARPDWEAAELAYTAMRRSSRLFPLLTAFDESLAAAPRSARAYTQFRELQSTQPELRRAVEAIEDSGFDWSLDRLDNVIGTPRASEIDPLARLRSTLGPDAVAALESLQTDPGARRRLEPWWQVQYGDATIGPGPAYADLITALGETPGGLAAWRDREALITADKHSAQWIQYWHRRVAREKTLGPRYYDYVAAANEDASILGSNRAQFAQALAGRTWPPQGEPPALEPDAARPSIHSRPDRESLRPDRPERSSEVVRPRRPVRPSRAGTDSEYTERRPPRPPKPAPPDFVRPNREPVPPR
jgi:hypothetical protein